MGFTVFVLLVGSLLLMRGESRAALEYDNGSVADVMLRYVGQNGVNVCRDAGRSQAYPGQCKQTVNCVLSIASGGRQYPVSGANHNEQFRIAGGIEQSSTGATKGDIIQIETSGMLHTAVIVNNLGNNRFTVVDSNWNYDTTVKVHDWTLPSGAKIWRMGTVFPLSPPSASLPSCGAIAANTTCIWRLTSSSNGYHFYTADINERNNLVNNGSYSYETLAFYGRTTHTTGTMPVYRLRWANKHFWTTNTIERDNLISSLGAVNEGIVWYANGPTLSSGYNVYRLADPVSGDHLWTISVEEADNLVRIGWVREGAPFYGSSPMVADNVKVAGAENVFRVALPNEHFYTSVIAERDAALRLPGAVYEGVAWTASDHANGKPIYRFLRPDGRHFWTAGQDGEKDTLMSTPGWRYEGVVWYESDDATRSVYRLHNPSTNRHFWTANEQERNTVVNNLGYKSEGVGWRY